MTSWDDRFEGHEVWGELDALRETLDDAAHAAHEAKDAEAVEALERLKAVAQYVKGSLDQADPFLVSGQTLDQIQGTASNATQSVQQYVETGELSHISPAPATKNAAFYGDRMLRFAAEVPGPGPREEIGSLQRDATSFRQSVGQLIHNLQSEVEAVNSQAASSLEELQEEVEELEGTISSRIKAVENATREKQDTLTSEISDELQQLEKDVNHQQQRISDALDRFENSFETSEEERREDFNQLKSELNNDTDKLIKEIRNRGEEFIDEMEQSRDKVNNMMNLIAASGRARGFEKQADYERYAGYGWRGIAVLAMCGLIWASYWLVTEDVFARQFEWQGFLGKLTLLGTIGVLAAYAVRQGREHLRRERINRQLQLELTSIDPYLAELPSETRHEIMERMVDRWYGNLPVDGALADEADSESRESLADDLRQLLEDRRELVTGDDESA